MFSGLLTFDETAAQQGGKWLKPFHPFGVIQRFIATALQSFYTFRGSRLDLQQLQLFSNLIFRYEKQNFACFPPLSEIKKAHRIQRTRDAYGVNTTEPERFSLSVSFCKFCEREKNVPTLICADWIITFLRRSAVSAGNKKRNILLNGQF